MTRNYQIDNAKFLMMLFVVFGHLIEIVIETSPMIKTIYMSIYAFHMPVLVILSGMVVSDINSSERHRKNIESLIIPLIIFTVLYELLNLITTEKISHYTLNFQPYWILWFLFSLFVWRTLLPISLQFRYPLLLGLLVSLAAGFIHDVGYFLGVSRTLYFFPFFILGYKLGSLGLSSGLLLKVPKFAYLLVLFLSILVFWTLREEPHQWLFGSFSYLRLGHEHIDAALIRVCMYLISLLTAISVLMLIPRKESFMSKLGRNSLLVYLWHGFIVKLAIHFELMTVLDSISSPLILVILAILATVLTILLSADYVSNWTRKLLFRPASRLILSSR